MCHVTIWCQPPSGWETRTEPHLNLVCPNGVPIDRKLCLLLLSHLQALSETPPPPCGRITMQVHPDHMIQLQEGGEAWVEQTQGMRGKTRGERKETERSLGRDHTHRSNITHTTSHSVAIRSSVTMQRSRWVNPLSSPLSHFIQPLNLPPVPLLYRHRKWLPLMSANTRPQGDCRYSYLVERVV